MSDSPVESAAPGIRPSLAQGASLERREKRKYVQPLYSPAWEGLELAHKISNDQGPMGFFILSSCLFLHSSCTKLLAGPLFFKSS